MWDQFFRRWSELFFWWLPRTPQAPPEPDRGGAAAASERPIASSAPQAQQQPTPAPEAQATPAPRPEPPAQPTAEPSRPAAPDDLTVIKGIGPVVQDKLRALGISSFAELARADPDHLFDQLKGAQPVSKARIQEWIEAARGRPPAGN